MWRGEHTRDLVFAMMFCFGLVVIVWALMSDWPEGPPQVQLLRDWEASCTQRGRVVVHVIRFGDLCLSPEDVRR